jgi:hypothetical protein
LTALRGLTNPALRATFSNQARWEDCAAKAGLTPDSTVAVIPADSREAVAPLIGFRHIAGIKKWDAFARARYVTQLVDIDGESFDSTAELVSVTTTSVKSFYRNATVLRQAHDLFGLDARAAIAKGWPRIMVLNRAGADRRRDRLLAGVPTKPGYDRDEYPMAAGGGRGPAGLRRGKDPVGWRADVRLVPSGENRGAGSVVGIKLRRYCDGTRFRYARF